MTEASAWNQGRTCRRNEFATAAWRVRARPAPFLRATTPALSTRASGHGRSPSGGLWLVRSAGADPAPNCAECRLKFPRPRGGRTCRVLGRSRVAQASLRGGRRRQRADSGPALWTENARSTTPRRCARGMCPSRSMYPLRGASSCVPDYPLDDFSA